MTMHEIATWPLARHIVQYAVNSLWQLPLLWWRPKLIFGAIRAESAQLYPAGYMPDWIFHQEKSNFPDIRPGIPML